jgi:hypothetical protein
MNQVIATIPCTDERNWIGYFKLLWNSEMSGTIQLVDEEDEEEKDEEEQVKEEEEG